MGIERHQIVAEAYAASPGVTVHDRKLAMLMRQHREAMRDFREMQARESTGDIADAEIVEEGA